MAICSGNKESHCCYIDGRVCKYLEENTVEGRRWACGIRKDYSSWREVYEDDRYTNDVKPILDYIGIVDCGEWPRKNEICAICGVKG